VTLISPVLLLKLHQIISYEKQWFYAVFVSLVVGFDQCGVDLFSVYSCLLHLIRRLVVVCAFGVAIAGVV
jgi:hypothetical protein